MTCSTAAAGDRDAAAADAGGVGDIESGAVGLVFQQEVAETLQHRWPRRGRLHRGTVAQGPDSDRPLVKNQQPMDLSHTGAGSIEPLLARAVGEPALAAAGRQEIDQVLKATELVVADIRRRCLAQADQEAMESVERTEAELRVRRAEIQRLRGQLLDQATALAHRFDSLLDILEGADADLESMSRLKPAPQQPETSEEIAAIRMVVKDRRRITVSHETDESPFQTEGWPPAPTVAEQSWPPSDGDSEPLAAAQPIRRRWWRLWSREAA